MILAIGDAAISSRPLRMACKMPVRSIPAEKKLDRIAGGSAGPADLM